MLLLLFNELFNRAIYDYCLSVFEVLQKAQAEIPEPKSVESMQAQALKTLKDQYDTFVGYVYS